MSEPLSERDALRAFLAAEAGKPQPGQSLREASQRARQVAEDLLDWPVVRLRAAVDYEPRREMYSRLQWTREALPLAVLRPWPEMGGLPASFTSGSVVDTARAVSAGGVPASATRLAAMLDSLQASPESAAVLLCQTPPIVVPEECFSDRAPVLGAPWRVDDGCHRAVCLAVLDPNGRPSCIVGRPRNAFAI